MVLHIINEPWVVKFFEKSGRLAFRPSSENAPKDKVFLELKRIKSIQLLKQKDVAYNMPPDAVLVEYETENADYYRKFTVNVEEVEKLIRDGKLVVWTLKKLNIVTEWDADEAVAGYKIDLKTGDVEYWDDREELFDW